MMQPKTPRRDRLESLRGEQSRRESDLQHKLEYLTRLEATNPAKAELVGRSRCRHQGEFGEAAGRLRAQIAVLEALPPGALDSPESFMTWSEGGGESLWYSTLRVVGGEYDQKEWALSHSRKGRMSDGENGRWGWGTVSVLIPPTPIEDGQKEVGDMAAKAIVSSSGGLGRTVMHLLRQGWTWRKMDDRTEGRDDLGVGYAHLELMRAKALIYSEAAAELAAALGK